MEGAKRTELTKANEVSSEAKGNHTQEIHPEEAMQSPGMHSKYSEGTYEGKAPQPGNGGALDV